MPRFFLFFVVVIDLVGILIVVFELVVEVVLEVVVRIADVLKAEGWVAAGINAHEPPQDLSYEDVGSEAAGFALSRAGGGYVDQK